MKKIFKTMFFITLTLILLFVAVMVVSAVSYESSSSESVAIIGGADGPTAIFITSTLIFDNPLFYLMCVVAILLVVSAVGWVVTSKR